ncbi:MAG TPA: hypothetical protein VME92_04590 [Acetobacteraceae bacterium]|nr:hypothetical protein [Acetobacteraceae bacterium]
MKAAKKEATWSEWTFFVGFCGTTVIAITLWFTRRSANAAHRAALVLPTIEAAHVFIVPNENTVGISMNYGFGDGIRMGYMNETDTPTVTFYVQNLGKTPAMVNSIFAKIEIGRKPTDTSLVADEIVISDIFIASDGGRTGDIYVSGRKFVPGDKIPWMNDQIFLWFIGRVMYKDIFNNSRCTTFCWRYDKTHCFAPYGDKGNERN